MPASLTFQKRYLIIGLFFVRHPHTHYSHVQVSQEKSFADVKKDGTLRAKEPSLALLLDGRGLREELSGLVLALTRAPVISAYLLGLRD